MVGFVWSLSEKRERKEKKLCRYCRETMAKRVGKANEENDLNPRIRESIQIDERMHV